MAARTRLREWQKKLLLVLGSTLVALALFEAIVEISGVDYNISPNWKYHRVLGWTQVPNAHFEDAVDDGTLAIDFNALGFRDVAHSLEKPLGTRRIVVIGDSFCEALQVRLSETFFEILNDKLNARGEGKWEVINLGVGDFGNAQELIALKEYGLRYDPDVVIQEIFPLNDICNDSVELADACKSENDRYRPYYSESRGELKLVMAQPVQSFLRKHLASYGLIDRALLSQRKVDTQREYDAMIQRLGTAPAGPLLGVYLPPGQQAPRVERAWHTADAILRKTAGVCRDRGIVYVPLAVPFEGTVDEGAEAFREELPGFTPGYPEERLHNLFEEVGTPLVSVSAEFDRRSREVLPYIDGHFNKAAHRIVAEALYARLEGLLPQLGAVKAPK